MRGHLRQRSKGSWELIVDAGRDPLTGKRRQRSRTFRGSKREAERELRALIDDVEAGRLTGTGTTFGHLLDAWLEMSANRLTATTLREYRRLSAKRISPALGDIPLIKLSPPTLDDLYRALAETEGLSPSSIRQVHSIIRRALKQGVKWGWIQHNPATNATPPVVRRRRKSPPGVEEIRVLIEDAEAHSPMFGLIVRLAVATGLRRGELCGLQWRDLDEAGAQLDVARAVAATPGGAAVKSNRGVRFHDLRHAHATHLLARGVDIPTVSSRLGHANSSTALNIYAHALESNDRAAADLISGLIS